MESALVFTHDRHKNQTMKKVPKLAKVADVDPSEFSSPYVKRKSMSLNQDIVEPPLQGGGGHLSMRTLTISSLSRDERRGLRKKLKLDLSEVKRIVRMIEARQEHLLMTEKVKPKEASGGKKPGHVSSGGKKAGHGLRVGRPKGGMDLMKQCSTLLKKVMSHKHAWVFNKPVNAEELGILDYHTVIKKPMDLGTVKKKLESGHYPDPIGFAEDVRLTFFNAMSYNPQGHDVYIMASTLAAAFEKLWKGIAGKLQQHRGDAGGEVVQEEERLLSDNPSLLNDRVEKTRPPLPRKREMPVARTVVQSKPESVDIVRRPMTFEEKEKLSKQMESLPEDKLIHVIQIMRKRHPEIGEDNEEVEVDIESIDNETLWELERFISNYVKSKEKKSKMIPRRNQEASQVENLERRMWILMMIWHLLNLPLWRLTKMVEQMERVALLVTAGIQDLLPVILTLIAHQVVNQKRRMFKEAVWQPRPHHIVRIKILCNKVVLAVALAAVVLV
ncbi:unnamed protein product [Sphagnum jensenii]|uniref:Uncharacterized protein n=1 Tax=Sphagnum jensenii TaxID=128206 RepID=A0ABP1AC24_9BRYO